MAQVKSTIEAKKIMEIMDDPVKWAQVFLNIFDPIQKKVVPWIARWYQGEMLRDESLKKVYRCGRRTGKTETMVADSLHKTYKNKNYRVLFITPYENQVRLIFNRIKEIIETSPLIKNEVVKMTSNPYQIMFRNGASILGFTTGASSGNGGASIRGQKADWIFLDEVDYMAEGDFDTITTIAAERSDIGITMSSTPTGKRSQFYKACVDKKMGYVEHFHPSPHNPNWNEKMEAEFRAQLSEQGYVHEILAEFGTQDTGVFDKEKVDMSTQVLNYTYDKLTYLQREKLEKNNSKPPIYYLFDKDNPPPYNPFRTIGVDWDKYGASSSIIILDYDVKLQKFIVIKRIEVPRSEYSYDTAVNMIIELNELYKPAWIYADAGSGEHQIERLHIYGDKHPESMLKNKVKRWQFKQSIDIEDPITREITKNPMKPFMVNQLQIIFERRKMILSPFDEVLHKQLIDYEVVRKQTNGDPIFTSVNEHFVDALGLAFLAFVLEFPELTKLIDKAEPRSFEIKTSNKKLGEARYKNLWNNINSQFNVNKNIAVDDDLPGDKPTLIEVPLNYKPNSYNNRSSWGSRSSTRKVNRSLW